MATARWQFFQKNDDDDTDDTDDTDLFLSSFSEKSIHYNIYIYYNATANYPYRKKINTPTVIGVIVIAVIDGSAFAYLCGLR